MTKKDGTLSEIDVYAVFPNDLVMWTDATKGSRLHRGAESDGRITEATRLATLTNTAGGNVFNRTVHMEANAVVSETVRPSASPSWSWSWRFSVAVNIFEPISCAFHAVI